MTTLLQNLLWLFILIFALGAIILISSLVFLIIFLSSLKKKKKSKLQAKEFYKQIVDAVGGIDNIVDVTVISSRLSLILKDSEVINSETFKNFISNNNIGMVKSSQKITLVIGEYASNYHLEIKKLLEEK